MGYVPEQTISHVKSSRPNAEARFCRDEVLCLKWNSVGVELYVLQVLGERWWGTF